MRISEIRNWLGLYFLLITGVLGGYLLLLHDSPLLPLTESEAMSSFQIVIPVLIGQLTVIFKWYGTEAVATEDVVVNLPTWVVKGPPLLVSALLVLGIGALVLGSWGEGHNWAPSPGNFKSLITFCVSLLNASTIFILARFFKAS